MAKAETAEMTPAAPVAKVGIVQLAIVAFVAVIGAVGAAGGLVWWMGKTGKLGGGGTKIVEVVKTEPQKTKDQVLEPMVVNLTDLGGRAYLRAAITLRVADEEKPGEAKKEEGGEKKPKAGGQQDVAVRDALIDVLGRKSSEELLQQEGKEQVKKEIKAVLTVREPSMKVVDIFFTEFLVQR